MATRSRQVTVLIFDPTLVADRGSTESPDVDPELVRKYPDLIPGRKKFFARFLELVGMLNREHVTLLAGTDLSVNFKWLSPGASLHDELELLVAAGLSPMDALQSATRNPGRFLHIDAGTIEVGKRADLVLLDANPLDDIHNVRKIRAQANPRSRNPRALGTVDVSRREAHVHHAIGALEVNTSQELRTTA